MADTKISDLTSATTTDGSEVLPVVQSATTKKMTVDVIKGFVLADPSVVTAETDPVTGDIIKSAGGVELLDPQIGDVNRRTQLYGQSLRKNHRINGGKCVYRFQNHTALTASGTNIASVTLSTVSGVNGIAANSSGSRTGSGQMVKLVGAAGATGNLLFTVPNAVLGSHAMEGRFGIWAYFDYANATVPTINGLWSPNVTVTDEMSNAWNSNAIRPGWNFLTFQQGAPSHPFGTSLSYGGTTDMIANPLKSFTLQFSTLANCTVYLDSLWTGFKQIPSIVLGWDTADQDALDYVLPAMNLRGWKGYIAEPCFIWTSGSTLYDDHSLDNARTQRVDQFAAAGWDIINHSTTHRAIGGLSNDYEIRYEIENARAWGLAHGWVRGSEFYASPQSSTSVTAETILRNAGLVVQRHAKHPNVHLTQFGVDNPHHLGSYDMGNQTYATIKSYIDMAVAYCCDLFMFAHNTIAGGAVDGSTVPGVSTQMYETTLNLVLDYIKSLETTGTVVVPDGMTGWYYG